MKSIILSALMLSTQLIKSQDLITKTDSSKLQTVILEVSPTEIKCKLFNYEDGPLLRITKSQIAYIVFKNGAIERCNATVISSKLTIGQTMSFSDRSASIFLSPKEKDTQCEKLYKYKNYVGFNHMAFLNNCVGFNYMRDVRKLHLIVNTPITIGFDACKITNVLHEKFHYEDQGELTFNKLNYQFGINLLFVPIMNRSTNFLIGPSYLFTSYNVTSTLYYNIPYHNTYVFKNNFEIKRHYYGISIGFLKRFDNRFNLTMLLTLGTKIDSYSKFDPFGTEYVKSIGGNYYSRSPDFLSLKSDVYANFMWTFGYRF